MIDGQGCRESRQGQNCMKLYDFATHLRTLAFNSDKCCEQENELDSLIIYKWNVTIGVEVRE